MIMNKYILLIIPIYVILLGCSDPKNKKDTFDRLMDFKGSYIGDSDAVGNILSLLELDYNGYSLMTARDPYSVIINVDDDAGENSVKMNSCAIALFTLISNVESITYSFDNQILFFNRSELNKKYNLNLYNSVNNKEELRNLLEKS